MNKSTIRLAQKELNILGASLTEDGDFGPITLAALKTHLASRSPRQITAEWTGWSKTRQLTAFIQLRAHDEGFDAGSIDGFWGPATEFGYNSLRYLREHGRELAVVHCQGTTSAPICERVGFRTVCDWEMYRSPAKVE